jgi:Uma2 family endonuclease
MADTSRLVTAEELERMPEDDYRYELVRGRLIRMSPAAPLHGRVAMAFGMLLGAHVKARNLGVVFPEVGFKLAFNPDTVRAPDMAFVSRTRMPRWDVRGFYKGPPDLAVEVLSPDDRPADVRDKVDDYLTHGTPIVLVLDPDEQSVTAHRRFMQPLELTTDDTLDLNDIVPGFRCRVGEIFDQGP